MSAEEQSPVERSYTELFRRLPQAPLPLGFRDRVMERIQRRPRPWQWAIAALVALPNLAFLAWELAGGGALGATFEEVAAVLATEDWSGEFAITVDGTTIIAVTLVGLAGMLMSYMLAAGRRSLGQT